MLKHLLLVGALIAVRVAAAPAEDPRPSLEERVLVVGDRTRAGPMEIPYSTDLTALKVIIRAGGYSDFSRTPIYLVRGGVVTKLDMRALERGESDKDVALKPWDIIVIGFRVSHH